MDRNELQEMINPVFPTAIGCLQTMAATGDTASLQLLKELGFPSLGEGARQEIPKGLLPAVMKYIAAASSCQEGRYLATDALLHARGVSQVLDLACGYTPRGLAFSQEGIHY